jgi:hypothetical protein
MDFVFHFGRFNLSHVCGIRVEVQSEFKDFFCMNFSHYERKLVIIEMSLRGVYESWMKSYAVDEIDLRKGWGTCNQSIALLGEKDKGQHLMTETICSMTNPTSFTICSGNLDNLLQAQHIPHLMESFPRNMKFQNIWKDPFQVL